MKRRDAIDYVLRGILAGRTDVEELKREACRKFRPDSMITNPELLAALQKRRPLHGRSGPARIAIRRLLLKKPSRTLSGVTPVAVMIRPQGSCRHRCVYCPAAGLAAKSYTGYEPAALRGRQYGFDPRLQAISRVEQFEGGGHPADKCEVIVMGGTFLETPKNYRTAFIKGIYEGLNGRKARTLPAAIRANERAPHRAVGLTIETRPDACTPYMRELLSYGATRVELGVQHPDDRIYRLVKRGHAVKDVVDATRELKDAAFKVLYHIMPGMPGSDRKKDIGFVKKLFTDQRFRPDMLKIYPTLVVAGSALAKWAEEGRFEPYSAEDAADVISEFYRQIPSYVRVMRIQRDIPAGRIQSGVKKSNLRELVEARMREKGIVAKEIRSREIGLRGVRFDPADFTLRRLDYAASGGKEHFISSENQDGLIAGFVRLRFPLRSCRREIDSACALVRELHVYGSEVPIEAAAGRNAQHRGIGAELLEEAEAVARDAGKDRILVISGVGAREYYRKHGYSLRGPYMSKKL
jgi:elongator complex protein 3